MHKDHSHHYRASGKVRRKVAALSSAALVLSLVSIATAEPAAAVSGPLPLIENFEGSVPIGTTGPGLFGFGADALSTPNLTIAAAPDLPGTASGNHALDVPYTVGGYGGFSDDLAAAQDWSVYGGFSFWVKGTGSG